MGGDGDTTRLPGAFWRLWTAGTISNLGDGVFAVALPLLAARVTDDRLSVGLISTFFTIPWLLFAIPVGVLIDRSDRRKVMVMADMFRGALVGAVALVAALSDVQMWMLWVLAFGLGVGEVFFDNTAQTILPAIVPADSLERANGLFTVSEVSTNMFSGNRPSSVLVLEQLDAASLGALIALYEHRVAVSGMVWGMRRRR